MEVHILIWGRELEAASTEAILQYVWQRRTTKMTGLLSRQDGSMQIRTAKNDPDLYDFEMPLQGAFYPLGFPLQIATNSHEVLAAAEESWGHFQQEFHVTPLRVRIGVLDGGPVECPAAPTVRAQGNILARVADPENFSVTDRMKSFAFAWLTRAAIENRSYLRWHFIEALPGICWTSISPLSMERACSGTTAEFFCAEIREQGSRRLRLPVRLKAGRTCPMIRAG